MAVVEDLFAMFAAAGLQFPYLGAVLIGTGLVLVCVGIIFWRRAAQQEAIGKPRDAAAFAPEEGKSDNENSDGRLVS
jgi:hypothetical protein